MTLRGFITRRVLESIVTILVVATINFFLFRVMPGNPYGVLQESQLAPEQILALMKSLGLDRPLLEQYPMYLMNMFTGNWGLSIRQSGRPVVTIILERLPNTLILMLPIFLLTLVISLLLGILMGRRRGKLTDTSLLAFFLSLSSLPTFWVGGVLLLVFSVMLGIFPVAGIVTVGISHPNMLAYAIDVLYHLVLPGVTLLIVSIGGWILLVRNSILDVFTEEYIVTAEAKGLDPKTIMYKHALKNAMLPIITSVAMSFGFLFSGAVFTETVFSWPGVGRLMYDSAMARDYPVLEGSFFVLTVCVVLANLITDVVYGYLDPRIKY